MGPARAATNGMGPRVTRVAMLELDCGGPTPEVDLMLDLMLGLEAAGFRS